MIGPERRDNKIPMEEMSLKWMESLVLEYSLLVLHGLSTFPPSHLPCCETSLPFSFLKIRPRKSFSFREGRYRRCIALVCFFLTLIAFFALNPFDSNSCDSPVPFFFFFFFFFPFGRCTSHRACTPEIGVLSTHVVVLLLYPMFVCT